MNFTISDIARKQIESIKPTPESCLRLLVKGGGCSGLSYELAWVTEPQENDKIVIDGQGTTLFIESKSSLFLNNAELDYEDSLTNGGFKVNSSKFKNVCGCGESFSL